MLVAEILSPSTALRDRNTKFKLYQSQGILYYLIISQDIRQVEVYQWENGKYSLKTKGGDIRYTFELPDCKVEIDLKQIW